MALVVLALAVTAAVMAQVVSGGLRAAGALDLPAALNLLAAGASALLLTWLTVSVALTTAAEVLPRWRLALAATATTPAVLHRLVCLALGAAVAGGVVAPAAAGDRPDVVVAAPVQVDPVQLDPAWASDPSAAADDTTGVLDPGWTPATPAKAPRVATSPELLTGAPQQVAEPGEVVVRRGDTLWDLAARVLPPTATDAEIAAEWPRWYAANVTTIGPDPDLLLPGQRLRVPADTSEARR